MDFMCAFCRRTMIEYSCPNTDCVSNGGTVNVTGAPTHPSFLKKDPINKPPHYTSGKIEVIDFIEDQGLDFALGNATKYIARAGKKDISKTKEDLQKAIWYIQRFIDKLETKGDVK